MSGPDYRIILKRALENRSSKNPSYSLRAFARDLKLVPSHISGVLKGSLGLSRQSAHRVGRALGLTEKEVENFVDLVESKHGRSQTSKKLAKIRIQKYRKLKRVNPISNDQFRVIADWYHLALLELTYLKNFSFDPVKIAKKLGVSVLAVTEGLGRLQRLGLVTTRGTSFRATNDWNEVGSDIPSEAIRSFHRQVLQKAEASLEFQSLEEREVNSTIMAIRIDKLKEARQMLRKFHKDFCISVGESEKYKYEKEDIYCLSSSFFCLSQDRKGNGK